MVAWSSLTACSSDPADAFPDASSFCSAYADEVCNAFATGCGTTAATCKTPVTNSCVSTGPTGIGISGHAYQASNAQPCIDKAHALFQSRSPSTDDVKAYDDACGRVFQGSAAKNAGCQSDFDCSSDLICDKGVCATKVTKSASDPCNNPGEVCGDGNFCNDLTGKGNKICNPDAAQGMPCNADIPCQDTLRCQLGSCSAKATNGGVCTANTDCPLTSTEPYCDTLSTTCLPKYTHGTQSCKDIGGS